MNSPKDLLGLPGDPVFLLHNHFEPGLVYPVDFKCLSLRKLADFEARFGVPFDQIEEIELGTPTRALEVFSYLIWLLIRHMRGQPTLEWVEENLTLDHIEQIQTWLAQQQKKGGLAAAAEQAGSTSPDSSEANSASPSVS